MNWEFVWAELTSITAWRDWELKRGQDPDFSNLDLLRRTAYNQRFKTFTQELRLQSRALDNLLDCPVGAYYTKDTMRMTDSLGFGSAYGVLQSYHMVRHAAATLTIPTSVPLHPAAPRGINPPLAL